MKRKFQLILVLVLAIAMIFSAISVFADEDMEDERPIFFFFPDYQTSGGFLPGVINLLLFQDYEDGEFPDYIENVEITYYDSTGEIILPSEDEELPDGVYFARWTNYEEFLAMDLEQGWGFQNNYNIVINRIYAGQPECIITMETEEFDIASVFGSGSMDMIFFMTTLVCLGVIVYLSVKLKKAEKTE